jgi:hypothetical protein
MLNGGIKLALQLHPDKNGAPGADEAFKSMCIVLHLRHSSPLPLIQWSPRLSKYSQILKSEQFSISMVQIPTRGLQECLHQALQIVLEEPVRLEKNLVRKTCSICSSAEQAQQVLAAWVDLVDQLVSSHFIIVDVVD